MAELGVLNPKYWYVDDFGNIKKLIYCKLCHAGPFKESEKKLKFDFFGMGNRDPYCTSCAGALKYFQNTPIKNHKKAEEIKEDRKQSLRSSQTKNPFETLPTRERQEPDIQEWD